MIHSFKLIKTDQTNYKNMKTISELEQEIRDFITSPRKRAVVEQDLADWGKLVSSLDVIGDTEQAFDSYLDMEEPENSGEKYLIIYGVLQALFIQQDAVIHLCEALNLTYTPDSQITAIREIRNDSSGHPTKRGGGKGRAFNRISRMSMKFGSYKLETFYPDGTSKIVDIEIPKLIESQRSILQTSLDDIIEKLKEEEMLHRKTFRDIKMVDFFPKNIEGEYKIIDDVIEGKLSANEGVSSINVMIDGVKLFESELQTRAISEGYEHTVGEQIKKLENPLNEMLQHLENATKSKLSKENLEDLRTHIRKDMSILIQMAEEIDKDYSTEL